LSSESIFDEVMILLLSRLSRRNAFLIENLESSELLSIFAIRIIKE